MQHPRIVHIAATTYAFVCLLATSAFGQITVSSPANNSTVPMPVQITASFAGCGGSSSGFGYSVGNSPFITWGYSTTQINNTDYRLTPSSTPYVIHFKGWTGGTLCETNVNVTVTGPSTTTASNIEDLPNSDWKWVFDTGTSGSASGTTNLVSGSPCQDSQCREFTMSFTNNGGMRGSTDFGNSEGATNFVYDAYIYLTDPAYVQNVEMDTNQVWDSSNDVLIYGTQCSNDGYWQYTTNASGKDTWNNSSISCLQPKYWSANNWHHAQIKVHRDGNGYGYYDTVTFDGKTYTINKNGFDSFPLNWSPNGLLLLNFQLDGLGSSGSITAYVDGLTEIWW
jgi:hypothetical protein